MKPILIDALHINMSGALAILNRLIDRLIAKDVDFVLLKDDRCPKLRSEQRISSMVVMSCGEKERKKYYQKHRTDFKSVLCLGNIPPAIKMAVPVYTYIHNVSLLKIPEDYTLGRKFKSLLKRIYIRHLSNHTDYWVVQTNNTAKLVDKYINRNKLQILVLPFFHIPNNINRTDINNRKDYVFIGVYTQAKGHEYLVEAWGILAKLGITPTLHLTADVDEMIKPISNAISMGAKIDNHGYVSFEEVIELYNKSKAIVYPSLNESLGLGIIEAAEAGCDVIGCNLPYIHSVCIPSETFIPKDPNSIVEAIIKYERGESPKTQLLIKDMADELIALLQQEIA